MVDKNDNFDKARKWCKHFPVFRKPMLLKIGIETDLRKQYDKKPREFGWCQVRKYLAYRTRRPWYQELLKKRDILPRAGIKKGDVKNLLPLQKEVLK